MEWIVAKRVPETIRANPKPFRKPVNPIGEIAVSLRGGDVPMLQEPPVLPGFGLIPRDEQGTAIAEDLIDPVIVPWRAVHDRTCDPFYNLQLPGRFQDALGVSPRNTIDTYQNG